MFISAADFKWNYYIFQHLGNWSPSHCCSIYANHHIISISTNISTKSTKNKIVSPGSVLVAWPSLVGVQPVPILVVPKYQDVGNLGAHILVVNGNAVTHWPDPVLFGELLLVPCGYFFVLLGQLVVRWLFLLLHLLARQKLHIAPGLTHNIEDGLGLRVVPMPLSLRIGIVYGILCIQIILDSFLGLVGLDPKQFQLVHPANVDGAHPHVALIFRVYLH